MSKADGKQIAVKFTMPLLGDVTGNVSAFSVTGQEYKYINGPIIAKTYTVTSVVAHPTEPRTLLITVDQFARFNNVEGQIKVSYNSALGTLVGVGGAVQNFEVYFTPTDLLREINPNDEETIRTVISSAVLDYTDVTIVNP